jgi:hypothetical protein
MANPVIQNNDNLQLEVFNPKYEDAIIKFTGALTYARGVIMAKVLVAAGAITPDVGNVGDGTATLLAIAPGGPPIPGDWNLECTQVGVTHGGRFKLEDPNGEQVGGDFNMSDVAGDTLLVSAGGIEVLLTDGATNFAVGDKFALTITDLEGKWVPWVEDAVDGTGQAMGVMPSTESATGAEDQYRRMLTSGEVHFLYLSVQAGGTVPQKALDQLRDFTILDVKGVRNDILDNQ